MGKAITSPGIHFNKYKIDVNFFVKIYLLARLKTSQKTMYLNWLIQMNAPAKAYRLLSAHNFLDLN